MRLCLKCGEKIPNRTVINGETKNIQNRKYCLECSPYGKHNTKKIHLHTKDKNNETCRCILCERVYIYNRQSGMTKEKCNSCLVNFRKTERKERMVKYKGGECILCGYNKCKSALSFHHLDPNEKSFNISGNHCRKWEIVKKELDKCVLLCHNCHSEVEAGLVVL